jgi:hypothetical protein
MPGHQKTDLESTPGGELHGKMRPDNECDFTRYANMLGDQNYQASLVQITESLWCLEWKPHSRIPLFS